MIDKTQRIALALENLIKELVTHSSDVKVTFTNASQSIIFEVVVNDSDVCKVIGVAGKTANSLRYLLYRMSEGLQQRILLEIIQPKSFISNKKPRFNQPLIHSAIEVGSRYGRN